MSELLPCPFCGGRGRVMRRFDAHGDKYCVVCADCGAQGQPAFICEWHDTKFIAQGKAAKSWNRRVKNG